MQAKKSDIPRKANKSINLLYTYLFFMYAQSTAVSLYEMLCHLNLANCHQISYLNYTNILCPH